MMNEYRRLDMGYIGAFVMGVLSGVFTTGVLAGRKNR